MVVSRAANERLETSSAQMTNPFLVVVFGIERFDVNPSAVPDRCLLAASIPFQPRFPSLRA